MALALAAWLFAVPIGLCVGIARVSTSRSLSWIAQFYVSVFRNIPLLLQMFAWFFMVPELLPTRMGLWFKRDLPDPEKVQQIAMAAGLLTDTLRRIDQQERGIRLCGAGDHVAQELGVPGGVDQNHVARGRAEANLTGVEGDPLLALGLQCVQQE